MGWHSDSLAGACNYCVHARWAYRGKYWYCTCNQDYFPDADWGSCPSYDRDPEYPEDDDD